MIDARALTADLRRLVTRLEDDMRGHIDATPDLAARVRAEHSAAMKAGRTANDLDVWRDEQITFAAVAWVLACVFVRFCEDNALISQARLAGPGERLTHAQDTTTHYFQQHPSHSDREYLLWVFEEAAALPGMRELLDRAHNPLHQLPPSVDGARELLAFWRSTDPQSAALVHDFNDPDRATRFLGDLYQDLSEAARKRYALLQTPEFVQEFILERTLEPAIDEFGLEKTSLIDPACGSGHFLLGAFARLLGHWREREPATNIRELCRRGLGQIAGVDVNPYAVAIARFRLLVVALNACEIARLSDAPDFHIEVATGDSLLHGHRPGQLPAMEQAAARAEFQHLYAVENADELRRILDRRYAVVVANPPYITPKDPALNQAYRDRYETCYRAYALSVPFMERLFDLAEHANGVAPAGYVGQITANSFMKREFGKRLVDEYLPKWDLTHVIDTSGAYIPGHGTPTVILFSRGRRAVSSTVRGVLGVRGEPSTPADPAEGKVWSEVLSLVDRPGIEGEYISTEELQRDRLSRHPWSLQGGGAGEVAAAIERGAVGTLAERIEDIGRTTHTGEDDVFYMPPASARTHRFAVDCVPVVEGDAVRNFVVSPTTVSLLPYDGEGEPREDLAEATRRHFWSMRTVLRARQDWGQRIEERGLRWYDHSMFFKERYSNPLSIAFAFVATHNHFVFDRGRKVFNRSAPVIKLQRGVDEDEHLALLGPLNSAAGCFWMKQVFYPKGGDQVGTEGARIRKTWWDERYEHDGTKLKRFPLPRDGSLRLARALDTAALELMATLPANVVASDAWSAERLRAARDDWHRIRGRMMALQEELDWRCYHLYGLLDDDLTLPLDEVPEIALGERAFEIVLARHVAAGKTETGWFERHGSTPITEIPSRWSRTYRELVEKRIEAIEGVKAIGLIERPEYKRRWQTDEWEAMQEQALRHWLLDRLEREDVWREPRLQTASEVSDRLLGDAEVVEALVLYGGGDAQVGPVVAELLANESVPYLAPLRYTDSGQRKRAVWERTWERQRAEDEGRVDGPIPTPPAYKQDDFRSGGFWRLRGKLDVPKERFTSFPGAGPNRETIYGWAGWDHAERAQAVAARLITAQEVEGAPAAVLEPLLAGLLELLPWLEQWHGEPDPRYGVPLSDFYATFLDERRQALGLTREQLTAWRPTDTPRRRRRA